MWLSGDSIGPATAGDDTVMVGRSSREIVQQVHLPASRD
jgi:hypothetical protein